MNIELIKISCVNMNNADAHEYIRIYNLNIGQAIELHDFINQYCKGE